MSASDPGLCRVAVHAGTAAVDLALPAAVPVATLIPPIVDMLGDHRTDPVATRFQLSRLGGSTLPGSTTLAQNDIRDGAVLVLNQSTPEPPTPRCDDVAEVVSATLDTTTRTLCRRTVRLTGSLAAGGLTTIGALVLLRNALSTGATRHSGVTTAVAAAACLIALLFAGIAHRTYRDPIAGLTLGIIATVFAAVAGLLGVPGAPGAPNALLAAMAAAVTSVLAMRVTDCGVVTLTAMACSAVYIGVAALAGVITSAPPHVIASLAALVSVGLLEVSPRLSIMLAGLSPTLPHTCALDDDDALPAADLPATKAIRADCWLTSLLAAFASLAAICATVAALATPDAIVLAAVTGAILLLRARSHIDRRRSLVFFISGIGTTAVVFAVAATDRPEHGPWIATLTAMLVAIALHLGFVAPGISPSPVARRSVEALEYLALISLTPLTCWICGVFNAVRHLDLT